MTEKKDAIARGEIPSSPSSRADRIQARAADTAQRLNAPATFRNYPIAGGEISVVTLPVADSDGFVEQQRCYVWRDAEFRASSVSCEPRPEMAAPRGGLTP